ncbi:hypothetical protein HQQ82_08515 [Rathayibacter sp. VKM Ac-2856]|uniref:hypothetical protein n=1 Tax=unclassified Rathayibacter TaxID=2609250 RepID=UPI001566B1D0|nr:MULTISPECIES: hypothetical protein [unclassified Rathayibacter]NQX04843.1 hypothetical protein [Rathayibacter sp. VKM Ac-2858]NQX20011.1 hypothetical protein [Rathayibacter sp. VKM Ac-2856]
MTDSTRTDPRFPSAYQRGYRGPGAAAGPAGGAGAGEERFRRPRPGDAVGARRRPEPAVPHAAAPRVEDAPRRAPLPRGGESVVAGGAPQIFDPRATEPRAIEDDGSVPESQAPESQAPRRSALDVRVPVALAVLGVLFVAVGLAMVWAAASAVYYSNGSEVEQFTRAMMNYLPGPAITTGLLSIGAAFTVRAVRS